MFLSRMYNYRPEGPAGGDLTGTYPAPVSIAIGAASAAYANNNISIGSSAAAVNSASNGNYNSPQKCIQLGHTGILPTRDYSVHIGNDLNECDGNINFADVLISDSDTRVVTIPKSLVVAESIGLSHDVRLSYIECCICETDEQRSLRARRERIRKRLEEGTLVPMDGAEIHIEPLTSEDIALVDNYKPALKPGFAWVHEGHERTMCINCIYEASFDFMARTTLEKYTAGDTEPIENTANSNNVENSNRAETAENTISELQARIAKLEAIVEKLAQ